LRAKIQKKKNMKNEKIKNIFLIFECL
jgi:hypothetical protein